MIHNETMLIERCQEGDRYAFDQLLSLHQKKAYDYALHMTRHVEDASDIASEASLKAFKAIGRFQQNSSFSTWLCRIVHRCFLDQRKRRRPIVVASLDATDCDMNGHLAVEFPEPTDPAQTPLENSLQNLHSGSVRKVLAQLPEPHRDLLLMYHDDELSCAEIANKIGCPIGTVKSRLSRAREALKKLVDADQELLDIVAI